MGPMNRERKHYVVFWAMQNFRNESRCMTEAEATVLFGLDPLILMIGEKLPEEPYFKTFLDRGDEIELELSTHVPFRELRRRAIAYGYTIDEAGKVTAPLPEVEAAAVAARTQESQDHE